MTASTQAATPEPTRCQRCHRILKNASPDGYGPRCRQYVRRSARQPEITGQYKAAGVQRAVELIESGGLVPLRRTGKNVVFLAVSSDGSRTYRTAGGGQCNCAAGLKAKYACFHGIAARIVTLSSRHLTTAA